MVIPNGTIVHFVYTQGYPPTAYNYCGIITYWNGGSYDIRVGNKTYYRIPEDSIVVAS
jgi:hypothetical protein